MEKRYDYLDVMKAIAMILVVALHTPLFRYNFIEEPSLLSTIQYGFRLILEGVPIFITINGFLLLKKEKLDIKKHISKILRTLLIIVLWSLILIVLGNIITESGRTITPRYLIHSILTTSRDNEYNGALWFLQSLITLYIIYPVLWKAYKDDFNIFKYTFIIISILAIGTNVLTMMSNVINTIKSTSYLREMVFALEQFNPFNLLWLTFYFMFGGMIYRNLNIIKKNRKIFIILAIIAWILAFGYGYYMSIKEHKVFQEWFNSNSIFMIFIILGLFALTINYKKKENIISKVLASIGQNTLGIYLTHFIFIFIRWNYLVVNFYQRAISFLFVFSCSYLLTLILKKIPIVNKYLLM